MSNWQEWVVWILLVLCVARIVWGGYRFYRRTKRGESPCAGCSSPCKNRENAKIGKKNCCG